jgi:hypothetical protein
MTNLRPTFLALAPAAVMERAQRLRAVAQASISAAAFQRRESRRLRYERTLVRSIWSECSADPDHIVVCCSYCARVHRPEGWSAIPPDQSKILHGSPAVRLSHGLCEDCLARHFPAMAP